MKNLDILFLSVVIFSFAACNKKVAPSIEADKTPESGISEKRIVDLSHSYSDKTIYWVTAKEFELDTVFKGETEKGYFYAANNFSIEDIQAWENNQKKMFLKSVSSCSKPVSQGFIPIS
jgi:hypothetical protein